MNDKRKEEATVEYEIVLKIKVKGDFTYNKKQETFEEGCFHTSTIAQWVLEDIEDDFEDKKYEVIGFDEFRLKNKDKKNYE